MLQGVRGSWFIGSEANLLGLGFGDKGLEFSLSPATQRSPLQREPFWASIKQSPPRDPKPKTLTPNLKPPRMKPFWGVVKEHLMWRTRKFYNKVLQVTNTTRGYYPQYCIQSGVCPWIVCSNCCNPLSNLFLMVLKGDGGSKYTDNYRGIYGHYMSYSLNS